MDNIDQCAPSDGAAQKAEAVFRAICEGHRHIGEIAAATRLHPTTVIRVAAILRDLGCIGAGKEEELELMPVFPCSA